MVWGKAAECGWVWLDNQDGLPGGGGPWKLNVGEGMVLLHERRQERSESGSGVGR